jgi:hypothetical protein
VDRCGQNRENTTAALSEKGDSGVERTSGMGCPFIVTCPVEQSGRSGKALRMGVMVDAVADTNGVLVL